MTSRQRLATAFLAALAAGCFAWGIHDATLGKWWLAGGWVSLSGMWFLIAAFPWLARRRYRTITITIFPNIKNGENDEQAQDHH